MFDRARQSIEQLDPILHWRGIVLVQKRHAQFARKSFAVSQRVFGIQLRCRPERFGDRLTVEISASREAERAQVPSLLLQPQIENAIKYAIAPSETSGTLSVQAACVDGELVLTVEDDGPGLSDGDDDGALSANTRRSRYRSFNE